MTTSYIRWQIKKLVFLALYPLWLLRKKRANSLLVLTYHRISEKRDLNDPLKVSKDCFDKQISYLRQNYYILSSGRLAEIIENNKPIPDRSCLITFDDGWRDNYTCAYPILRKYNVPAIIFISTDYIGTNRVFWHDRLQALIKNTQHEFAKEKLTEYLYDWPDDITAMISDVYESPGSSRYEKMNYLIEALKKLNPEKIDDLNNILSRFITRPDEHDPSPVMLSWEHVLEMAKNNISFESHTKSHAILTQTTERDIIEELKESKAIIESKVGKTVNFISYPNGNYNNEICGCAEQLGYIAAFTTINGHNYSFSRPYELMRMHILEEVSLGFTGKFSRLFFKIDLSGFRSFLKESRWYRKPPKP